MKFSVVTTFNSTGYQSYGKRMIETFAQNWPGNVDLLVYTEGCNIESTTPNVKVFDLEQASPALVTFKNTWRGIPKANGDVSLDPVRGKRKDSGKGFKWDAVRFAHKVYAIFAAATESKTDWLLWMDADMVCHSAITISDIKRLCPSDKDICFLGRKNKYTECGLYAMNLQSPRIQNFLKQFQQYYDQAEQGIFTLDEWHDSFVFDAVRKQHQLVELDWSGHLVSGEGHPLINSEWGAYLDHLKGSRKNLGRSKSKDLLVTRLEKYWLQHS
jgi:hypothetical protein